MKYLSYTRQAFVVSISAIINLINVGVVQARTPNLSTNSILKFEQKFLDLAMDYRRSDTVVWLQVEDCGVETLGKGIHVLWVAGKSLHVFKGIWNTTGHFHTQINEAKPPKCYNKGQKIGAFLVHEDPALMRQFRYKAIENSGFTTQDLPNIRKLGDANTMRLATKQVLEGRDGELVNEEAKWVTAKVVQVEAPSRYKNNYFEHQTITIKPLKTVKDARMQAGKLYKIEIGEANLSGYHLKYLLKKGNDYEFPVWIDDVGRLPTSNIEFIVTLLKP